MSDLDIPHQVLSEHFQERMSGRRLIAAVFTAFQLDPGFFEREILPVFLDVNLSHAPAIKLVQLEDCLRGIPESVAVYYDANGLVLTDDGAAKLDVRRVPVRLRTGIFHPKNVFALVEDTEPDATGRHPRRLLVAATSANLTRAGWWQNVECCHVEELEERSVTNLRDGLLAFFRTMRAVSPEGTDHSTLDVIADFVRKTEQRAQRKVDGEIQAHFFPGNGAFDDFMVDVLGSDVRDLYMEVLSPYFDKDDHSEPLERLIKRLRPREVRVLLPRNAAGDAEVKAELYTWLDDHASAAWGKLPGALVRSGKGEEARPRTVHAKVYRFFSMQRREEYLAIGSVNLTRAAHQHGGNLESAIVLQTSPPRRPDFWLALDRSRPAAFVEPDRDDDGDLAVADSGSRLSLRFHWDDARGEAYWDAATTSPRLELRSNGIPLFVLEELEPRTCVALDQPAAQALRASLVTTSFLTVHGDREEPVHILVQEEGMWKKPPLLSQLSVRDILKYWSLLTAEQRNEFIQLRAAELLGEGDGDLVPRVKRLEDLDTLFDRFAGTFHAFECVEQSVAKALDAKNEKEALYRIFGTKHDSLGNLLQRVRDDDERDLVEKYVIILCARQLCRELKRRWPELWTQHAQSSSELDALLGTGDDVRARLIEKQPDDMPAFLDWFDRWFLDKAKPLEPAS